MFEVGGVPPSKKFSIDPAPINGKKSNSTNVRSVQFLSYFWSKNVFVTM